MRRRRSYLEIIVDILGMGEASQTRIIYEGGMNYHQAQRYLNFLVDIGFLERVSGDHRTYYKPTERGKEFRERVKPILNCLYGDGEIEL